MFLPTPVAVAVVIIEPIVIYVPSQRVVHLSRMVHYGRMRTNVTLDDDVHQLASIYASAKGITLGAAISELIRKAQAMPAPAPDLRRSQSGLAMFPPSGNLLTAQMVKEAESALE
jgi:hypothetical protein